MLGPIKRRAGKDKKYYKLIYDLFGVSAGNIDVYKLALIHRSASITLPDGTPANNERLEFLGDAVLEAIVTDYLFIEYNEQTEGFLTQIRSRIVSRTMLDEIASQMGLQKYLIANFNGGTSGKHMCGNALEAMVGAIYLDKGYNYTNRFVINKILVPNIDLESLRASETDYKSRLIEWCQKSRREIKFETKTHPESTMNSPIFTSTVIIDGIKLGSGTGSSKKEAEQQAAQSISHLISDEMGDYFLETIDNSFENLRPDGQIN